MITLLLALACLLSFAALAAAVLAWRAAARPAAPQAHLDVLNAIDRLERATRDTPRDLKLEVGEFRKELKQELVALSTGLQTRLAQGEQAQSDHLSKLRLESAQGRKDADEALGGHVTRFGEVQTSRLGETNTAMKELRERTEAALKAMTERLDAMNAGAAERQEAQRAHLQANLDALREGNEKKLDEMRATVDEKLQATLDQRLDSSFKQVSDRLESVQKGLGEMQTLATGVGDLKRVLSNVKSRGTWGELQLGALLDDTLTADQFAAQVQVRPRSAERVDYAVRLPGHDESGQVWLPIDCKFPHEDYARLLAAQDAADPVAVAAAGKALEQAIVKQAKTLAEKYICPPHTTDFAYLYVPTEGLFAELVRREGFTAELRARHKVEVAGPSTLTALLNSLRVGFRSLQIQKKSSEVVTELGKVKTAFERYGDALDAVDKKLSEAKNKVSEVSDRHRAVLKSLRHVAAMPEVEALPAAEPLLTLAPPVEDEDDAEAA